MAQQTAVEWLADKLINEEPYPIKWNKYIEQAKEMEKEQIIDAYKYGQNNEFSHVMVGKILITGEEYYEQTFTTQLHDKQQS